MKWKPNCHWLGINAATFFYNWISEAGIARWHEHPETVPLQRCTTLGTGNGNISWRACICTDTGGIVQCRSPRKRSSSVWFKSPFRQQFYVGGICHWITRRHSGSAVNPTTPTNPRRVEINRVGLAGFVNSKSSFFYKFMGIDVSAYYITTYDAAPRAPRRKPLCSNDLRQIIACQTHTKFLIDIQSQ